jgi:hypothetical protein
MCTFCAMWNWVMQNLDRVFSILAIVIAVVAMLDVRELFKQLEERDKNTETRMRKELLTHFVFTRHVRLCCPIH